MLPDWVAALLTLVFQAWSARRDKQIKFLKLQVELMRRHMPGNRVILTPDERTRVLQAGKRLDHHVDDLIEIVSPKTYRRWLREQQAGQIPRRVGRPSSVTRSLRALILRLAKENAGWGVRRIIGELRKLAVPVSRGTVRRVLRADGLLPDPDRHAPKGVDTPWRTFMAANAESLLATDFFCKNVWTALGKRSAYCLMFVHVGSRRVFVSPSTLHPDDGWVQQQGRNALMWAEDEGLEVEFLVHDRDTKYTLRFDQLWKDAGAEIVKTPVASPIANCFAESWIGGLKRECLNHFVCFSLRQLDYIVGKYVGYYNRHRPHQGRENRPLCVEEDPPPQPIREPVGVIRRESALSGLLNHYYRDAA